MVNQSNNGQNQESSHASTSSSAFQANGGISNSYNPVLRQALIQLEEPSMTMHGLSINRLTAVGNASTNPSPMANMQGSFHLQRTQQLTGLGGHLSATPSNKPHKQHKVGGNTL